ncbi:hypothetical protein HY251_10955, partial [bacterium]|nr:hypothetical protein [bacterium]
VPWELDAICRKALEKDRNDRYQSALELQRDLLCFLEGRPIQARPGTAFYRFRKWISRNKKKAAAYTAGALVASGLVAATVAYEVQRERDRRRAIVEKTRKGWEDFSRRDYAPAEHAFGGARMLTGEDDRFALPDDLVAAIPSDVLAQLPAGPRTRLTGELLASWSTFVNQRVEEVKAQESATHLIDAGRAALSAGKLDDAQRAFVQALGFDGQSRTAQEGLGEAERLMGLAKARADAKAQLERDRAESVRLAEKGRTAIDARHTEEAKAAFLQALGFDGHNQAAIDGLAEATRLEQTMQKQKELADRFNEGKKGLEEARRALKKCRDFARQGVERKKVQTAYFEALQAFDRALLVAPEGSAESVELRSEKSGAARELARMATEDQNFGLAEYLLLIAGAPSAHEDPADSTPTDPLLLVREAHAVLIQRAFREPIEFEPSESWFKAPRDDLLLPLGQRFRLIVEICSKIEDGSPPRVYASGLKVSVEDKEKNITTAPEMLDFDGGPFPRVVVAQTSGRVMQPFWKAQGLKADARDSEVAKRFSKVVKDHLDRLRK